MRNRGSNFFHSNPVSADEDQQSQILLLDTVSHDANAFSETTWHVSNVFVFESDVAMCDEAMCDEAMCDEAMCDVAMCDVAMCDEAFFGGGMKKNLRHLHPPRRIS